MAAIRLRYAVVVIACFFATIELASAQIYGPPTGGWTYRYDGVEAAGGADFTALDGTWSHDNGSDAWDETGNGAGAPGGVTGGLTDGGTTFIRLQDTGDPRDDFPDPGNRKMYFGHDITAEGASDMVLDEGVTLTFRARLATGDPLDDYYPSGEWPAIGDGYGIHDGGKGTFSIKQGAGGVISFSLANETDGETAGVLRINNLNGTAPSADVDTGDEGTANVLPIGDATAWHEFWITIEGGGTGTHTVQVFRDGGPNPMSFDVTAGTGNDFGDLSYIAMGLGATPQTGAVDIDFFAWKNGIFLPGDSFELGDFNGDGSVDEMDYFVLSDSLAAHLNRAVEFSDGDIDLDGDVDLDDFGQFKELFPGAFAEAQGVPEPATITLVAFLLTMLAARRYWGAHRQLVA